MSSETTELLGLPYIMPSQAQKHVTHNEALQKLDALVHLAVESRGFAAPPAEPAPGERHIVAAEATGAWSGREGSIAAWLDSQWLFMAPNTGWLAWVEDEEKLLVFSAPGWIDFAPAAGASTMLGVNTEANETNRLAVKSDAVLISHDDVTPGTGDMRIVVNKAAPGQTASFVFQDDWSGRAEFGLTGNNNFSLKLSADGEDWKTAIGATSGGAVALGAATDFSANAGGDLSPAVAIGNDNTNNPTLALQAASPANAAGTRLDFFRARGSIASPEAVVNGDTIGVLNAFSFDGANYRQTAAIRLSADQNPTAGVDAPARITFNAGATSATERLRIAWNGVIRPGADNTQDLGASTHRWKDIHAGNGTIQTSDARAKTPPRSLMQAERAVAQNLSRLIGIFRWLEAVETKDDGARLHIGVTAQDVQAAFAAEGLDGFAYGVLCKDVWEAQPAEIGDGGEIETPALPAGERLGIRYDQLLVWIAAGVEERLAALETAAQ